MKVNVLLICFSVWLTSVNIFSQNALINIGKDRATFDEILNAIEEQSEYKVFYKNEQVNLQREVIFSSESATISKMLNEALEGTDIKYTLIDRVIVLSPRNENLMNYVTINGKIVSDDGTPLTGVNVIEKGTSKGTVTDTEGNYIITVSSSDAILVFSFIGYITEEVPVNSRSEINLSLTPGYLELEEIIVVGYGVQKKSDLTGAIASVSGDRLLETPVAGVDQALQGRAAGVFVTSETGAPGSDIVVHVRGISSINRADPLYVIDGAVSSPYSISALNPFDIESVEVLKDASSSAIYGASGGNGVILITTKKGIRDGIKAELDYYYGLQNSYRKIEMSNTDEFFAIYNDIMPEINRWAQSEIDNLPDIDYQDAIFGNAPISSLNLSISGGNEKSIYRFSTAYFFQEGVIENSKYTRLNFRINSVHNLGKRVTIGENIALSNENSFGYESWKINHGYESPIALAIQMHPFVEPYDDEGNWNTSPVSSVYNPFVELDVTDRYIPEYRALGDLNMQINIFEGLSYKTILGGDLSFQHSREFLPRYYYNPAYNNPRSQIQRRTQLSYSWSWQHTLQYNLSLGKHNIQGMAGFEAGYNFNEWQEGKRYNLIDESLEMHYFDASLDERSIILDGAGEDGANYAFFGRINYGYDGKYLFASNIRKDYSSKFGPDFRSGIFPAVSFGWKFSEEQFIKNAAILSFGKLRAGWGQMGNSSIDPYKYYALVRTENVYAYSIDNTVPPTTGASLHGIPNRELHWEAMNSTNIGIDLGFLGNRISLSADYFIKNNQGMLLERPVPSIGGTYQESPPNEGGETEYILNIGNNKNEGVDATLSFRNKKGKLKHIIDINLTYVKNTVGDIAGDTIINYATAFTFTNMNFTAEGYPMGSLYGFVTDGLFRPEDAEMIDGELVVTNQPYKTLPGGDIRYAQPFAKPGDIRFADINGDGTINDLDKTVIGNPHPELLLGFSYNLTFKNIDFTMFWQGAFGHDIFQLNKVWLYNNSGIFNWAEDAKERYRDPVYAEDGETILDPGNTDADLFRINLADRNNNLRLSDFYIEPGDYLRLKTIQLGYNLPEKLTGSLGIEKFRVYAGAKDLITFTSYPGFDPEITSRRDDPTNQGIDIAVYPRPRVFIFGFNAVF
ncbi:MAG: TonB-dependent receptor [Bacteroidales bacterium]|nr:MAG: TonB-dependent receptor [Bacteroidales bacterium]